MNIFGVCVMICGIAVSIAHPFSNQQQNRYARQVSHQLHDNIVHQRLKNFPTRPAQVIDYPGSVSQYGMSYVTSRPTLNTRVDYQQQQYMPVQQQQQQYMPIQQQQQQYIPVQQQQQQYISRIQPQFVSNQQFTGAASVQQTPPAVPVVPTVQPEPVTTITTTTTLPIVVRKERIEGVPAPAPIPSVQAPVQPQRRVRPRTRPVQPVQKVNQVRGQDFGDSNVLPETEVRVPHEETEEERLLREEQAKNAHYSFDTTIDDKINDHSISRQETREGLALRGMYSYSDGYFKRTIHYQADENGYRVVKEEIEPIGDGPQFNPNGIADVSTNLHNNQINYSITAEDFVRENNNKTITATDTDSA